MSGPAHRPVPLASNGDEAVDIYNVGTYDDDRMMTAEDAKKALSDFVADTYNHGDVEYTVEDATVEGFKEGVMLLPHQVKSRQWMAERESGKKAGGILADDMG